jgi:hypothetical protein
MRTREGQELRGGSPEEIVADLHSKSFTPEANDKAFMREVGRRTILQTGHRIRTTNADVFIQDLLALGLLLDVTDDDKVVVKRPYAKGEQYD